MRKTRSDSTIIFLTIILISFFISSAINNNQLHAQNITYTIEEDTLKPTFILDEVTVYSRANQQSVYSGALISSARMNRFAVNSVDELIKHDPGVMVTAGRKNSSSLSIRGLNSQSLLLLMDGRPVNTGYFGGADLSLIPASQIEKVQIIKGPASVAYGANSLGGIVNVISKGGARVDPTFEFQTFAGDLHHTETNASIGGSIGEYSGWFSVENVRWDGIQMSDKFTASDLENGGIRENSDMSRTSINLKAARFLTNKSYLSLMLGHTEAEKGLPTSIYQSEYWRFVDWTRNSGNIGLLYNPTLNLAIKTSIFMNNYDDELISYRDNSYSLDNINYDSKLKSLTWGGGFETEWKGVSSHTFAAGVRYQEDVSERRDVDTEDPWVKSTSQNVSVYAEDNYRISSDMVANAGIGLYTYHMDQAETDNSSLGYSAGFLKTWTESLTSRFSLGHSVFFPTHHNLYSAGRGNPELKPEETWKYELTLDKDHIFPGLQFSSASISLFFQNSRNQIDLSPDRRFININTMKTWGIELSSQSQLNRWLSVDLGGSLLFWEVDTETIFDTPHLKLNSRLTIQPVRNTDLNVEAAWYGEREAFIRGSDPLAIPSYLLLNANISYNLTDWVSLKLVSRNLLDKNYEEVYGYPGPGRQILGGVSIRKQL